jgi:aspartate kinase
MAAILRDQGIDAEYVSLEDIVPESYVTDDSDSSSEGKILGQDFYDDLAKAIAERIEQCGRRVPVVTGMWSQLHVSIGPCRFNVQLPGL